MKIKRMEKTKKLLSTACCFIAICASMWSFSVFAEEDELTIQAVTATYDHENSVTVFEGDVDLSSRDINLSAERIELLMLEDGNGKVTATGSPINFQIDSSDEEDEARGSAQTAIVDYSTETLHLKGDVVFEQGEVVVKTPEASYNWKNKELTTAQLTSESADSSQERTTITVQIGE